MPACIVKVWRTLLEHPVARALIRQPPPPASTREWPGGCGLDCGPPPWARPVPRLLVATGRAVASLLAHLQGNRLGVCAPTCPVPALVCQTQLNTHNPTIALAHTSRHLAQRGTPAWRCSPRFSPSGCFAAPQCADGTEQRRRGSSRLQAPPTSGPDCCWACWAWHAVVGSSCGILAPDATPLACNTSALFKFIGRDAPCRCLQRTQGCGWGGGWAWGPHVRHHDAMPGGAACMPNGCLGSGPESFIQAQTAPEQLDGEYQRGGGGWPGATGRLRIARRGPPASRKVCHSQRASPFRPLLPL
jgi:hypothetical protein